MRILLIAPMVPRQRGGGAIPVLLHAQLTGLLAANEVTLVSSVGDDPGEAEAADELLGAGVDAHFVDRRVPASALRRNRRRARLAATWLGRPWPWRTVWFAPPQMQLTIDRLAAGRRFDVVAVEDSSMSVFRLPAGVPAVLTEHEAFRAEAPAWSSAPLSRRPQALLSALDWRRWEGFQCQAWSRFPLIQVFSRGDAAEIGAAAPELEPRLRVNPFGLVLPASLPAAEEGDDTVLFVGNFTHPPNRDAALWLANEIMPLLRPRCRARLRIVGTLPPPEILALHADDVEVFADAPDLDPHFAAAAVVLAPIRTGGGMRMKVLEAIARRKAVVTTPLGAEGFNVFSPEPPLAIAADAEGIAAATAALLGDRERRQALAARARDYAETNFAPAPWATRLEAIYAEAGAPLAAGGGASGGEPRTAREPF
ncbi:MAG: glycosyltransferase [Actinobacteria bacterium]|nr:glycosyltransferase [Actinomycetota bacterium]